LCHLRRLFLRRLFLRRLFLRRLFLRRLFLRRLFLRRLSLRRIFLRRPAISIAISTNGDISTGSIASSTCISTVISIVIYLGRLGSRL
jgi:hypothetical protein